MPRYAVKVGEVHIVSDEPITEGHLKRVLRELKNTPGSVVASGEAVIRVTHPQP